LLEAELATGRPEAARLVRTFEAALPRFAERGFILIEGALSPEASSAAVTIRSDDPEGILALSCGGLSEALPPSVLERVGRDLLELARMLEPVAPAARSAGLPG
jgi:DNA-binding IclR family transcriptional regulator